MPKLSPVAHVADLTCPYCFIVCNRTSAVDSDAAPEPSDFNICMYCGNISVFAEDMSLKKVNPTDLHALTLKQQIDLGIAAMAVKAVTDIRKRDKNKVILPSDGIA